MAPGRESPHLGDEDALIGGVTGVPRMALGASSDADAQLLPRGLLNAEFPHAWRWWVPPHKQTQLQAGPEKGTDRLLMCGLPNILPIHCEDAVPNPKATASSQAPRKHLQERTTCSSLAGAGASCMSCLPGLLTLEMNTPGSWTPNGWLE